MSYRFRLAKFHTCCFTVSEKALAIFGDVFAYQRTESHFQGNWGGQDSLAQSRNKVALQKQTGTVVSRFKSENSDYTLVIESNLDEDYTLVAVEDDN
ncbi:hypothetical protein N9891_00035 [bacterium]|nr:hypothetical protein [bacterium]